MEREKNPKSSSSAVFKAGAVSLAFLIIGYQVALFVHRASVLHVEAVRDHPDTVYVYVTRPAAGAEAPDSAAAAPPSSPASSSEPERVEVRRNAEHAPAVAEVRERTRRVESFRFDPNTVGLEDLVRLGFTPKQAQAIVNYRQKGGRFRRKGDFAKSFVVSDSVYKRLEPFIDIPRLNINTADSAAFDALPGIGPYFAAQMVSYREKIGGYTSVDQLMDIPRFDEERLEGLKDLVECR